MVKDISEDLKINYSPLRHFYQGKAEGGPNDGQVMTGVTLTQFIPRLVKNITPYIVPGSQLSMSKDELEKYQQSVRNSVAQSIWAKNNPHRYDFDLDRRVWVYYVYPEFTIE